MREQFNDGAATFESLPSGWQLDAFIAVKILGMISTPIGGYDAATGKLHNKLGKSIILPKFSSDPAMALNLAFAMQRNGYTFTLSVNRIAFCEFEKDGAKWEAQEITKGAPEMALALAIVRAAVRVTTRQVTR